ncbi:MAG: hypothetical protein K0U98_06405 [Deltaproteobacteria bacterium]|nr:hypothetical protein [Deltaproteobacteria bacterium]
MRIVLASSVARWCVVFLVLSLLAIAPARAFAETLSRGFPEASFGTFSVTSTADGGAGTLRQAILDANANPGADKILFDFPGEPPYVIQPASPLPTLTEPVWIDGSTEPDFDGAPIVVLDGGLAGANAHGLHFETLLSTVTSLVIQNFSGHGLFLGGLGGYEVEGCYIGIDAAGITAQPNGLHGIFIDGNLQNKIGGPFPGQRNVISGNGGAGVYLASDTDGSGDSGTEIQGNFIGVGATGSMALGNGAGTGHSNIVIDSADDNIIGGLHPGQGNVISGAASGFGITITASPGEAAIGNLIQNNRVGTNSIGAGAVPNASGGIQLQGGAQNTLLLGNLISGNAPGPGVKIEGGSAANALYGNFIGLSLVGTALLPNFEGVLIEDASGNTIGNFDPANGNVISGNLDSGVVIRSTGALLGGDGQNRVQFNTIGARPNGAGPLGNSESGVSIVDSPGNLIHDNLISGNEVHGVVLSGAATGNELLRNTIGLDSTGSAAVPNLEQGVLIVGASGNVIGLPGEGNLISGNGPGDTGSGIHLSGSGTQNNLIQGNRIGLSGVSPGDVGLEGDSLGGVGNGMNGIALTGGASGNLIGGPEAGEGNLIGFNERAGIWISSGSGNSLSGNSIFDNGGLGIDILPPGVNENDSGDSDPGGNQMQNFPVLTSAINSPFYTQIEATLHSQAASSFVVEFFASPGCDDSGQGEGQVYLGADVAATDALGDASLSLMIPRTLAGPWVTATATDLLGNTSELSSCLELVEGECPECIFFDGFESGDTSAWSLVVGE